MSSEPTNVEKLRGLPASIAFSSANAIYCQLTFFGSAFVLFLSQLGFSKTWIGLILALFPFMALLALFVAPVAARWGYKRTFLTFQLSRTLITILLLFTAWMVSAWGLQAALAYILVVVTIFTLVRAIALTAFHPWQQEYIPHTVRGKYLAVDKIFASMATFLAVTASGYVLGDAPDLARFIVLFAAGVIFGLIAVWASSFIPGGLPLERARTRAMNAWGVLNTLHDRSFWFYLLGASLISLASGPLTSFLPLFMREQVGLSSGQVVMLQTGTLLGGLLSSYLWGWAADRYGSKPVMALGVYLHVLLPLLWLLMPRHSALSLHAALGIALLQGVITTGWGIGSGRLLYVSIVPAEKRTEYMATHYAWMGIVGGVGQLAGGQLLDYSAGLAGQFLVFRLDPYTILFVAGLVLPVMAGVLFRSVRADSRLSTGEFASMFLQGNPVLALESMVRFHRARDEQSLISVTERMGQAQSPLTVDELLEALADPRFYVRFEALVSIARMKPDTRLIQALIEILKGEEPALSVIAAWALGRLKDGRAIVPLREGLNARYRSVQAHCARSLGSLGDAQSAPVLLARLKGETDRGLQIAYASALGHLRVEEAAGTLLGLLWASQETASQMELALALARIAGDEHHFIQLVRRVRAEPGTAAAQALIEIKKRLGAEVAADGELAAAMDGSAEALAREDLAAGVPLLSELLGRLLAQDPPPRYAPILGECALRLKEAGTHRMEYVVLALHTLHAGCAQKQTGVFTRAFPAGGDDTPILDGAL
ncbi:MAG: MFS transporter [Thermoflexales bacterium]|nr:MFS transporter [Thermoflexales bacterium]